MADGRDNLGFKNGDESQPVKTILYIKTSTDESLHTPMQTTDQNLSSDRPSHERIRTLDLRDIKMQTKVNNRTDGRSPSVEAYAILDFVRFNKMTFQAQTSQQNDEFGSQESILIDGGVKPDPPELFECSPEWCQFFLISMLWVPGLVKNYSQIDKNNLLT